jgi:hypothetical protein
VADALMAFAFTAGLIEGNDCLQNAGDVNCDGLIDVEDAFLILLFAAGVPGLPELGCPGVGSAI